MQSAHFLFFVPTKKRRINLVAQVVAMGTCLCCQLLHNACHCPMTMCHHCVTLSDIQQHSGNMEYLWCTSVVRMWIIQHCVLGFIFCCAYSSGVSQQIIFAFKCSRANHATYKNSTNCTDIHLDAHSQPSASMRGQIFFGCM